VSMACPRPDVRRRQRRGAKLREEAQGPSSHPGVTGKGKTGRVNASEPPMMPRHVRVPPMGCVSGMKGLAAGMRQVPVE
jgi:hypothetical protein